MPNQSEPVLSLSVYLQAVQMTVEQIFEEDVWVMCEIRALHGKGGHYYFELADKNDDGKIGGACRATLWRTLAPRLLRKFESQAQMPLQSGLKVRLKGRANFHPQYGFSFNIKDIDPNYTVGELAQAYLALKNKLAANGLLDRNKALPLPFDLRRVAVVAPENAAGLGDFRAEADRLQRCGACRFDYHHATFQGAATNASLQLAIQAALAHTPDLLVVVRGGGAVGDLAYLNDYDVAAALANSPAPVWVGIGHERDTVLLDEVAQRRFDTPSKVVTAIENALRDRWLGAKRFFESVHRLSLQKTAQEQNALRALHQNLQAHGLRLCADQRHRVLFAFDALKNQSLQRLKDARAHQQHWRDLILGYHPDRVLKKGYAIACNDQGVWLSGVAQIDVGDDIKLRFKDGTLSARVHSKSPSPQSPNPPQNRE